MMLGVFSMSSITKIKPFFPYIFILVFMTGIILAGWFASHDDASLSSPPPNSLNENWVYVSDEETTVPLDVLPTRLNVEANEPMRIEITLPETFEDAQTLRIRTSLATVTAKLDGEVFYAHDFGERMTIASLWHMIDLPAGVENQTLTLTFESPYQAMSGRVNEISYGTRVQLYEDLLETFGLRLIIATILMIISILMMVVAFFMRKRMHPAYACLGLFGMLLALWLFAESRLMQFFIGNTFIIGSLSYIVLPLIILPIHGFFREVIIQKYRTIVTAFIALHLLAAFLVYSAHAFGVAAFFETTIITLVASSISMLGLFMVLFLEYKANPSSKIRQAFILYSVFLFFAFLEFVLFFQQSFMQTSAAAFIGVLVGIVAVIFYFVEFILTRYRASLEKDVYEKLAFIDPLTEGLNRMAYIRDATLAFHQAKQGTSIALVYFDLNNLKTINDNFGHHKGDAAIRALYDMIIEGFGDVGVCYRLGGDEFACLLEGVDPEIIEARQVDFKHYINDFNNATRFPFSVAIGYAIYDKDRDSDIEATMRRADEAMYKHKHAK